MTWPAVWAVSLSNLQVYCLGTQVACGFALLCAVICNGFDNVTFVDLA
jgi:hypothetical protein